MTWDRIVGSWKQLKDEIVFQWSRLADDKGTRFNLIGAEMSSDGQSSDVETTAFRPDEASFHCKLALTKSQLKRGESRW